MSILALIIKREFISKVRNKSFIVMTFVSPLIFVAIAVVAVAISVFVRIVAIFVIILCH